MLERAALERHGERRASADAAASVLSGLQFAVFERVAPWTFAEWNASPEWLIRLRARNPPAESLTQHFPSLDGFLPLAEDFWAASSAAPLQSDFWSETDLEGAEYHLLATALKAGPRCFLVIERAEATFINHHQLQLYAHEMVTLYETISQLNREVERATRAKSDFLATMSHEIRTPLNAMLGMADLLAESRLDHDQRKYVEVFQRSGATLLGLLNDILDLSKVEAGHLQLESLEFDLADTLASVLELTRVRAAAKGLEVGSFIAESVAPVLVGDSLRLRQILLNLLGNAMKFTDAGRLSIEVSPDPQDASRGALLFRVTDTGMGIPPEKLGSIFDVFSQADSSTSRNFGGSGLGLSISKRLVELMGGRIWVESTPGKGSTFLFTLELAVSERTDPAPRDRISLADRVASAADLPLAHILLADDSEDNRFLISEYLKRSPCVVEYAENGEIALGKMKCRHYDLVLMDAHMPVMDGYSATRAMREWERAQGHAPMPILALTADAFTEAVTESVAAGCNAHLTKPIAKRAIVQAIRTHALPCPHAEGQDSARARHSHAATSLSALSTRYLGNITHELQTLIAAAAEADYATMQRIGHKLHGSGASFGFPRITELGSAMEQAAKDHNLGSARGAVSQFTSYLEQLRATSS